MHIFLHAEQPWANRVSLIHIYSIHVFFCFFINYSNNIVWSVLVISSVLSQFIINVGCSLYI